MKIKRIISAAIAGVMLTTASATVFSAGKAEMPFKDVESGAWFYEPIKQIYDKGYMEGVEKDRFSPDGGLTRAQFVTILCRMSGGEQKITDRFKDVPSDRWYSGYVGWAESSGVVDGMTPDTFAPDKPMTRQEMAAAMVRYIKYRGIKLPRENKAPYEFTDEEKIAEWAEEYVKALRISGIVAGDDGVNYNPENGITRAETAKILCNLLSAEDKAWQGYVPDPSRDGWAVYGANYLYWGGSIVQGTLGTDVGTDGKYPILTAYQDRFTETLTYDDKNTIGISSAVSGFDPREFSVIKICFSYERDADASLTGQYSANNGGRNPKIAREPFALTEGNEDEGYRTATANLSAAIEATKDVIDYDNDFPHILFKPDENAGKLNIRYIAVFKDQKSADEFTSASYEDYLKNYKLYTDVSYSEISESESAKYDKELTSRINEIMSTESKYTPEQIEASGHEAYYVSSIRGDDSNDGLSPERPFKTLEALWTKKGPPTAPVLVTKAQPGDGVFFERGSVFYAEMYRTYSVTCLYTAPGVIYSAYGSGEKPVFTCAIDFTDSNNVGNWNATEYDNIWELDQIDPDPEWRGSKAGIGNIIFNGGEYIGVHIKSTLSSEDRETKPNIGAGTYTKNLGLQSNGKEIFHSGGGESVTLADALKNNLEFFHDEYEGKLYLYWDGGNPADSFSDIKVSRGGYVISANENTIVDNLSALYCASWLASADIFGSQFYNCELGYCGGQYSSIASGVETSGRKLSEYSIKDREKTKHIIENCYFHDIEDGPMSAQNSNSTEMTDNPMAIKNIEYKNNVILTSGNGAELFGGQPHLIDENGYMIDKMENLYIHDNIMAYMGYGINQQQGDTTKGTTSGDILCGSIYGEMVPGTCVFEKNTLYKCRAQIASAYVALDEQPRGWNLRNNTYILPQDVATLKNGYEDFITMNHSRNKDNRVSIPYNKRYLAYFTSLGFDPAGKFYHYGETSVNDGKFVFFLTGYYVERGITPNLIDKTK